MRASSGEMTSRPSQTDSERSSLFRDTSGEDTSLSLPVDAVAACDPVCLVSGDWPWTVGGDIGPSNETAEKAGVGSMDVSSTVLGIPESVAPAVSPGMGGTEVVISTGARLTGFTGALTTGVMIAGSTLMIGSENGVDVPPPPELPLPPLGLEA